MFRFFALLLILFPLIINGLSPKQILYKMRAGKVDQALVAYKGYAREKGAHDYPLLQEMALLLIRESFKQKEAEKQLLALWAASFSLNPKLLPVLEEGLKAEDPREVLATLFFLMNFPDDQAMNLIRKELNSPYLPIQLTAAAFLAEKKEKGILEQIERFLERLDPQFYPLVVPLFAPSDSRLSSAWMRKFLTSSNRETRLVAIIETARNQRDDLIPSLKEAVRSGSTEEQEAAAFSLGLLGDSQAIPLLEQIKQSSKKPLSTKLAASYALFRLGQNDLFIQQLAEKGDLYAINLLGQMQTGQDLLASLTNSPDSDVRLNAAIALLKAKDPRALPTLAALLHPHLRNLKITLLASPGQALSSWKLQAFTNTPTLSRGQIIEEASLLDTNHFLAFADLLVQFEDKELVSSIIWTVARLKTPAAIAFLQKQLVRPGAPLARSWATLALYSLKEKGPYGEAVRSWFSLQKQLAIVSITPPSLDSSLKSFHEVTKAESSELLLASLDTIASLRDQEAIDPVLDALIGGNPLNRPILASLLLRLSE